VFDLVKLVTVLSLCASIQLTYSFHSNKSFTFPFQNRKNIAAIALSPNGNILISVDEGESTLCQLSSPPLMCCNDTDGRSLLVNFRRGIVLHHFNFKKPVNAIEFSPNGSFIAVTHESHVQVWKTPNHLVREFAPFNLHRTYTGHHDEVLSIVWSPDSQFVMA
jgi:periodic tryptophan protein 2